MVTEKSVCGLNFNPNPTYSAMVTTLGAREHSFFDKMALTYRERRLNIRLTSMSFLE
jgi:hypothetical protein